MGKEIFMRRRRPEKLQKLCLVVAAKNFIKLLSSPSQEKGIGFLQRNSQLLLKAFEETDGNKIKLEHALFCLNRHLKELDLDLFEPYDLPAILIHLKTVECNLTVLAAKLIRYEMTLDLLWQLVLLLPRTLQRLSLNNSKCIDGMLEVVAERCPNLCELSLRGSNKITDCGIRVLCRKDKQQNICPNFKLKKLELRWTRETKEGITFALKYFPNLTELFYDTVSVVIHDICGNVTSNNGTSSSSYNLKSLIVLEPTRIQPCDVLKACCVLCPNVAKLEVEISAQGELDVCADFTSLKEISLFIREPCNILPFLEARGKALKGLIIYSVSEFSESWEAIVALCPKLEYLQLAGVELAEGKHCANPNLQCTLPHLRELAVWRHELENVERKLLFLISQCPELERFEFESVCFECVPSFLQFLNQHNSLVELKLHNSDINESKFLVSLPNFSIVNPFFNFVSNYFGYDTF